MHDIDWDHIRHFLEVVHAGSVSGAAQRLGVNQTTVSRRITALEKQLGKRLFDRSVNGWLITPVGEQIIVSAEHMLDEANAIGRHVQSDSEELRGRLRITVGDICTQRLAMPSIRTFIEKYPEVAIEVIATRDALDLTAFEADVALRQTDEPPHNLVGTRIAQLGYAVYGNEKMKTNLRDNAAKAEIPCVTWLGDGVSRPPWVEQNFPGTNSLYRSNDLGVILEMIRQGAGIAQIPCALGDPDPDLHRIPVKYVEPGWGLWVLSHVDLRTTARVRIFRDHLVADLREKKKMIEGLMPGS